MLPFVLMGKIIAYLNPIDAEYDVFFFFPGFAIGGAERVNAEIIKSISDKKAIIFFTKKSPNSGMRHFFELPNITIKEIGFWTDNKWLYWFNFIYRGICSTYINKQKNKPIIFNGQSNFGYKISPYIKSDIKIIELIHMYDPRFTWVWAPFIKYIDTRILISETIKEKFRNCYEKNKIPLKYLESIVIIDYCLEFLPKELTKKNFDLPLKIYYAGRGGPQKRVGMIVRIIEKCRQLNLPVIFKLAGPFKDELPSELIDNDIYLGEIQGGEDMYKLHQQNDILLMTSAWEGFPIVIMEAMSFGSIPLVTDVDAIPDHLFECQNAFLLDSSKTEQEIIEEAIQKIEFIIENRNLLSNISKRAFEDVTSKFSPQKFRNRYRELLLN
jgi:L-malate glycosyltransferase